MKGYFYSVKYSVDINELGYYVYKEYPLRYTKNWVSNGITEINGSVIDFINKAPTLDWTNCYRQYWDGEYVNTCMRTPSRDISLSSIKSVVFKKEIKRINFVSNTFNELRDILPATDYVEFIKTNKLNEV